MNFSALNFVIGIIIAGTHIYFQSVGKYDILFYFEI